MRPIPHTLRHRFWRRVENKRRRRRYGFTLVELVIVVLVMGIVAAAATPAFLDSLLYHRVESAARRVKADLELARHTARLTSAAQSITFTTSGYTLSNATRSFDNPTGQYSVNLLGPPYELVRVVADFDGSSSLTFDGYGMPTSGGTVTVGAGSHRCTLTLDGTTGAIAIDSEHARGVGVGPS